LTSVVDLTLQYEGVLHVCVQIVTLLLPFSFTIIQQLDMNMNYSLGFSHFCVKYDQDFLTAIEKEFKDEYNKYKDFFVKYHHENPAITTDCYKEYLQTVSKQEAVRVLLVKAELNHSRAKVYVNSFHGRQETVWVNKEDS
ncbi:11172_t:CDS:2, partial [Funneliformis mosseae]